MSSFHLCLGQEKEVLLENRSFFFFFVLNHAADGIFFSYIWLEEFLKNQLKKSIWSLSAHPHPDERSSDVS